MPSSALRAYCCWLRSEERIRIAVVAPVGSSEGRLMIRPVESCSWALASRPRPVCMPVSDCWLSMFWVMRTMAHQRTSPVRLIRVSSIESMVVITRAAAS